MSKLKVALKLWHPKLTRKLGLQISEKEELAVLLRAIDHKIPDRSHYPDWGKERFLRQLQKNSKVLDVGCGNDSPGFAKQILPDCHYVGLDIGDYNQNHPEVADQYVITSPSDFPHKITELGNDFDAVISSHNLEHCYDRDAVLRNMLQAIKPGGMLYLAFPSADSLTFPSRAGTLNYHDDDTHQNEPPDFGKTVSIISNAGFKIVFAASRYQPAARWLIGLYHEARSAAHRQVDTETWAYWGLEAIIWARRPMPALL
jgi:SAM-dependent methyltransferase